MSDCRFGVSPVNYPDPDPDCDCLIRIELIWSRRKMRPTLNFIYSTSITPKAQDVIEGAVGDFLWSIVLKETGLRCQTNTQGIGPRLAAVARKGFTASLSRS